jgi:putative PIN family toxin of toxin-antitoxin system
LTAPLRLVLDTNVVLSALLWEGRPGELLDLAAGDAVRLFTSEHLIEELRNSLAKPRLATRLLATGLTPDEHAANYAAMTAVIEPSALKAPVARDRDDDHVLGCARGAAANAIVTGDDDLLSLGAWEAVAIMRVTECLAVVAELGRRVG